MKAWNNNLDEHQEQVLLGIEHRGCWLAFWGLLAAILVQQVAFGADFSRIVGEWSVLMALGLYLSVECLRAGIWDRRLRPDGKTNFAISGIAGLVVGIVMFLQVFSSHPDKPIGSICAGIFSALLSGTGCFVMLQLSAVAYKKRVAQLEAESDDLEA